MLIQRQFKPDDSGKPQCSHVLVRHTGTNPEQNFSHRLVEQALADGWMQISGDTLIMSAEPENLRYTLKRTPGYYCTSTGERIDITPMAWARMQATGRGDLARREALAWLLAHGKASTDYEVTNAYECVLDAQQHARFKRVLAKA